MIDPADVSAAVGLVDSPRLVITGGPRTGKTTLSDRLQKAAPDSEHLHTDDLIGAFEWSALSDHVAGLMGEPGPWVKEGVATVRALRKWLAANADGRPCDVVIYLRVPKTETTSGQRAMARGTETIYAGIRDELLRRGVSLLEESDLASES